MADILDPSAISSALPNYLGTQKSLKSPHDALAALVHTILSVLGFRLVGIDESTTQGSFEGNVLPEGWNSHGPGSYTFRYRHEQSSLEFLVKLSKLGTRTVINAIAIESDKIASLDISTNDFTSAAFFPYTVGAPDAQPIVHGFISSSRIADFVARFKLAIVQKTIRGLNKVEYTETPEDSSTNSASQARPNPSSGQNQPPNHPELGPRFSPDRGSHISPQNPLQIGRSDLDPIPVHNQPNPFAPPSLFPRNPGDGMFVGPDHPIFGGAFGSRTDPAGRGPWGGDGYLPPMGAPPGARFDPVLPGPFGPGGSPFGRGSPFSGGRAPRRYGDPDNDELMPPGAGDMFS